VKYLPDRLTAAPPPEKWDRYVEYDAKAWPRRVKREMRLVPTICFNCESACGLLAYVDRETGKVRRFEGNPVHPGSRGRVCAKGPATLNQVEDPHRILYPLKRVGQRGGGNFANRRLWRRSEWLLGCRWRRNRRHRRVGGLRRRLRWGIRRRRDGRGQPDRDHSRHDHDRDSRAHVGCGADRTESVLERLRHVLEVD